jgi:hypothetical protein
MGEDSILKAIIEETKVVLLGTMHLEASGFPNYAQKLKDIISEISPNVICTELSPEQLSGEQPCNSKPEQRDVVMPLAKELDIPIIPIQLHTDAAIDWSNRLKNVEDEAIGEDRYKIYYGICNSLETCEAELWYEHMKSGNSIEHVQYNEYHVFSEARDRVDKQRFPQRARLMEEWNNSFLAVIDKAISDYTNGLLLVIVGLWHKGWLWNKLIDRKDLQVHNIHTLRDLRCNR